MLVAIICEYNPFHCGHIYQIEEVKKIYPSAKILAIMSGNLVQRGEFSIIEKKEKTRIALNHGIDMVVEIPAIFSLQAAENFSYYSVKLAKEIRADGISFGIESEINELKRFVEILEDNEDKLKKFIIEKKNYSHNEAIIKYFEEKHLIENRDIFRSNNILAIEYLKAMRKLNYDPKIIGIKRIVSAYNSNNLEDIAFSASAIRNNLDKMDILEKKLPHDTFTALNNHKSLSYQERLFSLLKYKLLIEKKSMAQITGYEKGIENILIKNLSYPVENFLEKISSRKYTKNRLKRLILNYILDIKKEHVDYFLKEDIKAVRLLGFNIDKLDFKALNKNIKLVSSYSHLKDLDDDYKFLFEKNIEASFLYENSNKISDYTEFPIIKKF